MSCFLYKSLKPTLLTSHKCQDPEHSRNCGADRRDNASDKSYLFKAPRRCRLYLSTTVQVVTLIVTPLIENLGSYIVHRGNLDT